MGGILNQEKNKKMENFQPPSGIILKWTNVWGKGKG